MVFVGAADSPAVPSKAGESAFETVLAEGERDRDGLERFPGLESEPPLVLDVGWP